MYNAFLQAKYQTDGAPQPVVELKWDASRPDEVGLRLADTPANDRIQRWRFAYSKAAGTCGVSCKATTAGSRPMNWLSVRENKPANSTVAWKLPDSPTADFRLIGNRRDVATASGKAAAKRMQA